MNTRIKIAAHWWSSFLKDEFTWDNGDGLQSALANSLVASAGKPSMQQIIQFEVALFDLIHNNLRKFNFSVWTCFEISVDYLPDKTLSEACDKSGIEIKQSTFPCKTNMEIYQDKILVKSGYGCAYEELKQPREASK